MNKKLEFDTETPGTRLDVFLAERCPNITRSRLKRLIADGLATVDGGPARPGLRLRAGQHVALTVPDPPEVRLDPQSIPVDVVFEDQDVIVVDKPAGLVVHPGSGRPDGTLANALLATRPGLERVGGSLRAGIVHRLDKDTSGLLVVARNEEAHSHLGRQFKERRVTKMYLALVRGNLSPPEAIIDAPVGRHPTDRRRMAVVTGGRPATTRYRVIERFDGFTLLEVRPATGRTHQVRVHMASLRHPLAGDAVYGKAHSELARHFLHASRLGFRLPSSDRYVELESPLPEELQRFLDGLTPAEKRRPK